MKYLVHIGYPKAGSTWLQSGLFSGIDSRLQPLRNSQKNKRYFKSGENLFNSPEIPILKDTLKKYVYPTYFDVGKAVKELEKNTQFNADVTILSNEVWTGHPFSGGITFDEYAQRIKKVIPKAKILIVVRRQEDLILSSYAHFVIKSGGLCDLKRFLSSKFHNQIPWSNPLYYCYHFLVERYIELFGKENVLVLPFELLLFRGSQEFVEPIYRFLDLEPIRFETTRTLKNSRNYNEYVLLSRFRFLNMFADSHPANGNYSKKIGFIYRLFKSIGKTFILRRLRDLAIQSDKDLIKRYFSPYAKYTNTVLQKFVSFNLRELGYSFEP